MSSWKVTNSPAVVRAVRLKNGVRSYQEALKTVNKTTQIKEFHVWVSNALDGFLEAHLLSWFLINSLVNLAPS